MKKEEKDQEIEFLIDWIMTIIRFSVKNGGLTSEDERETFAILQTPKVKSHISYVRMVVSGINEMADSMSPENIERLNAILREKFGMDLNTMKMRDRKKLDRLVKRGYLKTDNEFRMVEYWVNELCQTEAPDSEIDLLNALLSDYERRVEAKLAAKKSRKSAATSSDVSGNG